MITKELIEDAKAAGFQVDDAPGVKTRIYSVTYGEDITEHIEYLLQRQRERQAVPEYEFQVWQGDDCVAMGQAGSKEDVKREAEHYAMMYGQDGDVEIKYFVRYEVPELISPHPIVAELTKE